MLDMGSGLTGLQQLQALIATGQRFGIGESLGFTLTKIEKGYAAFESTPGEHVYNPIGTVHGGYTATLLDSACGCAVHSMLPGGQGYTTLELKVAYHKAMTAQTGKVLAEGRLLSFGRRVAFTEAKLCGLDGQLYASATSTLLLLALDSQ